MSTYQFTPEQELWLRDLETTEEPQTKGFLHRTKADGEDRPVGFCCLGRACVVLRFDLNYDEGGSYGDYRTYDFYEGEVAPPYIVRKLHLRSEVGGLANNWDDCPDLASANDKGKAFREIAAYIRANPTDVFLPPEDVS